MIVHGRLLSGVYVLQALAVLHIHAHAVCVLRTCCVPHTTYYQTLHTSGTS